MTNHGDDHWDNWGPELEPHEKADIDALERQLLRGQARVNGCLTITAIALIVVLVALIIRGIT